MCRKEGEIHRQAHETSSLSPLSKRFVWSGLRRSHIGVMKRDRDSVEARRYVDGHRVREPRVDESKCGWIVAADEIQPDGWSYRVVDAGGFKFPPP